MTVDQERQLAELCSRFGLNEHQISEMRVFVETVGDDAYTRGEVAGASPFDGSWPTGD